MNSANLVIILIIAAGVFLAIRPTIKHMKGEGSCCGGSSDSSKRKKKKKRQILVKIAIENS